MKSNLTFTLNNIIDCPVQVLVIDWFQNVTGKCVDELPMNSSWVELLSKMNERKREEVNYNQMHLPCFALVN